MRGLFRGAVVATGVSVVLLVPAAGLASTGGGAVLILSPTTSAGTYSYGTLDAGQTASQTLTLTNSGGTATAALSISLTGSSAFKKIGDTCSGAKLKPNTSCNVTVQYAPAAAGQNDGATLTATSDKPPPAASSGPKGAGATASPAPAPTPRAGGAVGAATVTDTAALSGGATPGGTIEFRLYGPSATPVCTTTAVFDKTVSVSGNGSYPSPSVTHPQSGA